MVSLPVYNYYIIIALTPGQVKHHILVIWDENIPSLAN